MSAHILKAFPGLKTTNFAVTSPQDFRYNCIAWAARDKSQLWWPDKTGYWPKEAPRAVDVKAFVAAFALEGYEECESRELEKGYEKVALYTNARGEPTHAARQMASGLWSSKLGLLEDIVHVLSGLEGKQYGHVAKVLRRPIRDPGSEPPVNPES